MEFWKAAEVNGSERVFAIKKVQLALITKNQLSKQMQREVDILYSLKHPHIICLHFDFSDGECQYLGMEYAEGGNMARELSLVGKFNLQTSAQYFHETCDALDYLHHQPDKVIHRDIKPENILLDANDHVKLADFGWANLMDVDLRGTFCGTLDYLPPEMILGTGHDESADMWNMGVLMYEMAIGKSPFAGATKEIICRNIVTVNLSFPDTCNDKDLKHLISSLLKKKPKERLTVRDTMRHTFIMKFVAPSTPSKAPTSQVGAQSTAPSEEPKLPPLSERDLSQEMQALLSAKQNLEENLMRLTKEVEVTHEALRVERKKRMEIDDKVKELERTIPERERELEELRRRSSQGNRIASSSWFGNRKNTESVTLT